MQRSKLAPSLLLAAAIGLAGCRSAVRAYDGPARSDSEVAHIIGAKGPDLLVAINSPNGGRPTAGMPEAISIEGVDGKDIEGSDLIDVLPGQRTLEVYGSRIEFNPDRLVSNLVALEFQAEAGQTYTITAEPSEHQRPWSYVLTNSASGEVVARTEPTLGELDLVALPAEARDWDVATWSKTVPYEFVTCAKPTGAGGEAPEFLQRERKTLSDKLTAEAHRSRRVREREQSGFSAEGSGLEGERWVERWEALQPDRDGMFEYGVGVYRLEGSAFYSIVYATHSRSVEPAIFMTLHRQHPPIGV